MKSKPIQIPRDLKPGDVIVDNHGTRHTVKYVSGLSGHKTGSPYYTDGAVLVYRNEESEGIYDYFNPDGGAHCGDFHAIRIERIASKAKVTKDAAWLLSLCASRPRPGSPVVLTVSQVTFARRIRAIARRLNGGKP